MADKFDKQSDEINEFFSEFDKIAEAEKPSTVQPSDPPASGSRGKSKGRLNDPAAAEKPARAKNGKEKTQDKKAGKKKKPKSKVGRFFKFFGLFILACVIVGAVYVGIVVAKTPKDNISPDKIYSELSQRSTIYDDRGNVIENISMVGGNRDNVPYEDLPKDLINAVVSIEDKTFWKHHGFNFIRMAGAIKSSVFGGGQISGTSTITQQLARNVYLAKRMSERSLSRKISEAYITLMIEQNLSKEQIMEAYLNTISLGYDCYGVEAASRAYFGKSVKKLDLLQCASLSALPKSPSAYALVKRKESGTTSVNNSNILAKDSSMLYVYNGDISKDRRNLAIKNMVDQKYISQADADNALGQDLRKKMHISVDKGSGFSSYFNDYAIDQITQDIVEEYGMPEQEARDMIYTKGLRIYTTMNKKIQKIVETSFSQNYGYPSVVNLRKDGDGNILGKNGQILLYDYDDYFDASGTFTLSKNDYKKNSDGSLTIYAGKRLKLYDVQVGGASDISIEFKTMYLYVDGKLNTIEGGAISIPPGFKTKDAAGNCIVSASFMEKYPKFFKRSGGNLLINKTNYTLKQKVIQPQSAMVIMDYKSGGIKAMVGGRNTEGKMLYNRAIKPRQPGSSIKPIAIYASGIQSGYNAVNSGETLSLDNSGGNDWGRYITAGSIINDAQITYNGKAWPKNWYPGFKGQMTLRHAVEQSVNVCAVKTYQQMGPEFPMSQLKKMGITTLDEENDRNPAALALGGMTTGISPLQMAGAYGIFPNEGEYKEPVTYTKITNKDNEVLFDKNPKTEPVLDPGVAFIMTDVLHSVVTNGLGKTAAIGSQPVAGKTGTTSDNFDAWFVGFTPQYTAALWVGNDVNIQLSVGSAAAAGLWRTIMSQVCAGTPYGRFPEAPSNVVQIGGEYYIKDTYSKVTKPTKKTSETTTEETTEEPTTSLPTTSPATPTPLPTTLPPTTTMPPTTEPETTTGP